MNYVLVVVEKNISIVVVNRGVKMKEVKKVVIVIIIIIGILMLWPLSKYAKKVKGQRIYDAIMEIYGGPDYSLIYLGSSNCSFSNQFDSVMEETSEEYDFKYAFVDILDLTDKQRDELIKKIGIDQNDFGTPYIVVGKEKTKESEHKGYLKKENLVEFLKENNFLAADAEPKIINEDSLNYIEANEFVELINSKEKQIIVIGQIHCGACSWAVPVLEEIAEEYELLINYINIDQIDNNLDRQKLDEEIRKLGITELRTPYIMIIQEGQELGSFLGASEKDGYLEFFKKYDLIKR